MLDTIRGVLAKVMSEGIREDEMQRARRKIASGLVIHDETPNGRLFHFGFEWLSRTRYRTVDEEIDRYLAVTKEDVQRFLERRPFDVLSAVALGPIGSLA